MSQISSIKILLVEDDEIDFFIFENYIREIGDKRLTVEWCDDYTQALFKMADGAYDLYFVDYRLGESTALNLLEEMGKFGFHQPVIVLTGKGSRNVDVQAMERGATDYLVKSELNAEKLERSIRYALDRAKALKAIRESENKYRSLFEQSGDAIFIADRFLFLREVNIAASRLFETNEETLTTHNLYHFLDDGKTSQVLYQAIENKEAVTNLEITIKTERQRNRICLLTVSCIEYDNQSRFHCILRDITEFKKAENVNQQIEKMDATEKLIRMLGHEIRNPLTNIGLAVDSLIHQAEDEDHRMMLDIISRNSNKINFLIAELIDSTKTSDFNFELVSLQGLMDETLSAASDRIALRKVKLSKLYNADACYIMADRKKLKIALGNLIVNAVEAMQTEDAEISVEISADNDHYFLNIKDNGHGIPREFISKLFEPFSTLKKNGLGLGLATAHNIIKRHSASIEVESETGEGSNFQLRFIKQATVLNEPKKDKIYWQKNNARS